MKLEQQFKHMVCLGEDLTANQTSGDALPGECFQSTASTLRLNYLVTIFLVIAASSMMCLSEV